MPLRIPPLRERAGDIPDLVRHFMQKAESDGLSVNLIDNEALGVLNNHLWPGNVRELENLVRRLLALYPQETITKQVIEHELASDQSPFGQIGMAALDHSSQKSLSETTEQYVIDYFAKNGIERDNEPVNGETPTGLYQQLLREIEYPLIVTTLAATSGNQIKAAELLGLNRNTLRKKMKELNIKVQRTLR